MAMILPAVDIRGGRCVRLLQGRLDAETVYYDRPADAALRWAEQGAELIHVVDLDGAFAGRPENFDAVAAVVREVDVPVEVGGGVRTDATVGRYVDLGVERVVVGSRAFRDPGWLVGLCERFAGRIVAGVDARDGRVAVEGWAEVSEVDALDFARQLDGLGLRAIAFTDVATDGMMAGPNFQAMAEMASAVTTGVIASGGVTTVSDVTQLATTGVAGCIIGRSLYEGSLTLRDALAASRKGCVESP